MLDDSQRYPPRAQSWAAAITLAVLYAFAVVDRAVLSMLIGPIKKDLAINDFQVGLLVGTAFALTYVGGAIPFGMLSDRFPRRNVIFAGLLIWSLATIACGFAVSFTLLFLLRMLVGVGESALVPSAVPLIGDLFPPERRSLPLSLYQGMANVGGALATFASGLLLDWSFRKGGTIELAGHSFSAWQLVFLAVGIPGLALLLLTVKLPEPRVAKREHAALPGIWDFSRKHRRLLIFFCLAFAADATVIATFSAWTAEYLVRGLGWSKSEVGAILSLLLLVPPILSHIVTGFLVDRMITRGSTDAPIRLCLIMTVVGLPFGILVYATSSSAVAILSIFAMKVFIIPSLQFAHISLQQFVPPNLRGRATGAFMSFISFFGLAVGPMAVGALTHYVLKDDKALGTAMVYIVGTALAIMCPCLWLCLKPMREAVGEARRQELAR